jgi:hypothetical protein
MTDKTRHRIEYGLIAIIFGAGAGWGAYQMQLAELDRRLGRIEDRVTAIYCQQVPEQIRGACQ